MVKASTRLRILREAKRMVAVERWNDFINDYRQFFHRVRVGYYSERLIYANRWLLNDEQQQIDAYYSAKDPRRK